MTANTPALEPDEAPDGAAVAQAFSDLAEADLAPAADLERSATAQARATRAGVYATLAAAAQLGRIADWLEHVRLVDPSELDDEEGES